MIRRIEAFSLLVFFVAACGSQSPQPADAGTTGQNNGSDSGGDTQSEAPSQRVCDTATSEAECVDLGCERWADGFIRDITGVGPDESTCVPPETIAWCAAAVPDQGSNLCE